MASRARASDVSAIKSVETAATVGSISVRMPSHICLGSVGCRLPLTKMATTTSSNEVMKASSAPDTTPGRMSGSVTSRNVCQRPAPRFWAASSSVWSKPRSVAVTTTTTNGSARTVCASTRPARVPTSRKRA